MHQKNFSSELSTKKRKLSSRNRENFFLTFEHNQHTQNRNKRLFSFSRVFTSHLSLTLFFSRFLIFTKNLILSSRFDNNCCLRNFNFSFNKGNEIPLISYFQKNFHSLKTQPEVDYSTTRHDKESEIFQCSHKIFSFSSLSAENDELAPDELS